MMRKRIFVFLLLPLLAAQAADLNVYFVGNSLTERTNLEDGLRGLVEEKQHTLSGQMDEDSFAHIVGGANLYWLWYHGNHLKPDPVNPYYIDDFGPELRTNRWDALVLQAYGGSKPWYWATTPLNTDWVYWQDRPREEGDIPMTSNFVDQCVNQGISGNGIKVYMYSQWPIVPGAAANPDYEAFDYKAAWDTLYTDPTKFSNRSRDYWQQIRQGVDGQWSGQLSNTVMMVPVGDALYELNERLRANPLTGASNVVYSDIEQVYGDGNHLSPGVSQYFKAMVFMATLYGEDPRGMSTGLYNDINWYHSLYRPYFVEITSEWKTLLQDVAWQVTATHFLAGRRELQAPGDANLDGVVNTNDYALLMAAWGRTDVDEHATGIGWRDGDFDGDGDVDYADLDIYQAHADSDADGLPDSWEIQYYGGATNANPAATASNGVNTVLDCYVAGLDPTDPDAIFELHSVGPLSWTSVSGRVYTIYWTSNLQSGFQALESNITAGAFTDTVHGAEGQGFYKIKVELE